MNQLVPRVLVRAPGGAEGVAAVVAAGRAGALGLLDLASAAPGVAREAIARASRWADRPFGVVMTPGMLAESADGWPDRLTAVVCEGGREADRGAAIGRIKGRGRAALAGVSTRDDAREAVAGGADGLIVSGLEAGGRCGSESSFVLLQGVIADGGGPAWVRGGIGPRSAAACLACGAAGVVLDGAVLLARESPLGEDDRERVARLDGGESAAIGPESGPTIRVDAPPGSAAVERLRAAASVGGHAWSEAVAGAVGWGPGRARPIGQDGAFAAGLASRHVTVGGIVRAVEEAIAEGLGGAARLRPLAGGSPMAEALGTRYPIVQGPMTRVSDSAAFAAAVADGGALPMLALAMLRGPEAAALLAETAGRLGDRPWGVGVLGFVDPALRAEQIGAIREARPPFALIAGGRPDQAEGLERIGIRTFLHAPSPGLLGQYLRDGARRFVLEGRECGGHVGPRSSLVLWEQAAAEILAAIEAGRVGDPGGLHLLFAGGVHDARSARAVASLAAPLAGRGAKVGVLVGTAYLFTKEAVETGAIAPRFQGEARRCRGTVLLPTGPGHEVRAAPSPFTAHFEAERRRLVEAGAPPEEVREALERLNVGRLRVATKGVDRGGGPGSPLEPLGEAEQYERGLYMIGQVAALRDDVTTIADLHRSIAEGAGAMPDVAGAEAGGGHPGARPSDVAIVGMAAIFPGAGDARTFWENTLKGVDAIVEIPPDRWDWRTYYDPDGKAPDKVVSKWGGFLPDVPFDPLRYGMPPVSLPSIEPAQLLVLEAVRAALEDAGYADRAFPRERTAVVLGMGGGAAQVAMGYAFRSYLPMLESVAPAAGREARERAEPLLPEWTEDSFPGFLLNVTAGRVANRFDLGGANYTVDAACGSSLAAASLAVRELESGAADVAILGGADTVQNPFTYLAFSKTHAFSPRGRCRPFDASADGIVISEGVGVVVLKRLADAERDGDRVYAVIKGVGGSSDGRARGLTAPDGDGQARALARAFAKAGVRPSGVGYVEAHGTGTAVGDVVEVNALAEFLRADGAAPASCAVGSVKSTIGHTKCAAGLAGLINASLALYHRTLPPTIGVERLNPGADLAAGPLRVSTAARPWLHSAEAPRRAGVSAFGFGGTNFHAVLEAYEGDPAPRPDPAREWPAELFIWRGDDRSELLGAVDRLSSAIDAGARPVLRDLAHTLIRRFDPDATDRPTLAIVSASLDDLRAKLSAARGAIAGGDEAPSDPRGVFFADRPGFAGDRVAFLFPGQGAQRPEMLGDLALAFDEVRTGYESFDAALEAAGRPAIGPRAFPPTALDDDARERARLALTAPDASQPAVGAASVGALRLLGALGIAPDAVAGHSFGELVALHASGAMGAEALALLAEARGRLLAEAAGPEPGTMAAWACDADRAEALIAGIDGVVVANRNGPRQAVIAGHRDAVNRAIDRARAEGIRSFDLPVGAAFHSPLVAGARGPMAGLARSAIARPPALPVFSNLDARPHPGDPAAIAERLGDHLASPVRFAAMVEAMYESGVRVFVECGPGATLGGLVGSILGDRPHLAASIDAPGRPGVPALLGALARLVVGGVAARGLDRLTARRGARRLDLDRLPTGDAPPSPTTWLVNGSRARPIAGPEPRRLGQAPEVLGLPREDRIADMTTSHDPIRTPAADGRPPREAPIAPDGHPAGLRNGRAASAGAIPPRAPAPRADGARAPDRNGRGPVPVPPSPPREPPAGADRVLEAFQETMRAFLDVQQATMLAYLAGRSLGRSEAPAPGVGATAANPHEPIREHEMAPIAAAPAVDPPAPPPEAGGGEGGPLPADPDPEPDLAASPEAAAEAGRPGPAGSGVGIAATLVEIVRDRTGYPAEMLGMGLDLEADLGIDSIKRVEILGTLRDSVAGLAGLAGSALMDGLARSKTLGEIVDRVEEALAAAHRTEAGPGPGPGPEPTRADRPEAARPLRRLVLEAVEAPRPATRSGLAPGGTVIVTDDGRGVARALADRLEGEGVVVEFAGRGWADLASPSSVAEAVGRARGDRPLAGIVHALPIGMAGDPGLDPARWLERMGPAVRGLFLLARAAADDLERSSRLGGSCLIAATAMGGAFASAGAVPEGFFPGQGGIAGLVKTLAREWPGVRARVVDLDPGEPAAALADRLATEALRDDGWPEVGYLGERRVRLRAVDRPLGSGGPALDLDPGDPIVMTGGARGITAAVAAELARRWRPTLLLVGSSPLPGDREASETTGIDAPAELKAALLARARRDGREVGPAELERAYRGVLRAREMRAAIARMREAGAEVDYARADVRDAEGLASALDSWRRRFGEPRGLVHGAGVIHDKLLRDKTPESFDRVLGTKLDGALNLARMLRGDALRFSAFFSSVAGRFGNQGQSDYAAANEALSKLAVRLDRDWPGRVVAVHWGPWAGVGMVSDLQDHLGRRGLGMIDPAIGGAALVDELRLGRKGEVEVILAGALGTLEGPLPAPEAEAAGVAR